jgi:hypothetical protein
MPDVLDNERFRKLLLALPGKAIEYLYTHYYNGLVNLSLRFTRHRGASEDTNYFLG